MQPWQDGQIEEIRERYRQLAAAELTGDRQARDAAAERDPALWKHAAELGLLGLCMPEDYGGSGLSISHTVAAFEGVAEGCPDGGFVYGLISQLFGVQIALLHMASEEVRAKYLPPAIAGDLSLVYGFTEPQGGSDAYLIETKAEQDGDDWLITGQKVLVTNAPAADVSLVFARTGKGRSPFALSAFVVDMDQPGAQIGQAFGKVGLRTVGLGELLFDNARAPASHLVARKGAGLQVITESTNWERAFLLVTALGQMRRVLAQVLDDANDRASGSIRSDFDAVSGPFADLVTRYRLCRMVTYDMAARLTVDGATNPHMLDAAIVKLFVSENYQAFMNDAMRLTGIAAATTDHEAQQHLRDSLSSTIYSGTSETLRKTIAKLQGLKDE
jgi:alkylation response protein AidB-like acyl-CoA dehydrogenase